MAALDAQRWLEEQRHSPEVAAAPASEGVATAPVSTLGRRGPSRWLETFVDPSRAEVDAALPPAGADPDVLEALATPSIPGREPRPLLEDHGSYVFGVIVPMLTPEDEATPQELCFVATAERLITVRKGTATGASFDVGALHAAEQTGSSVGALVHGLYDDATDSYLDLVDAVYAEIDTLEDEIDDSGHQRFG